MHLIELVEQFLCQTAVFEQILFDHFNWPLDRHCNVWNDGLTDTLGKNLVTYSLEPRVIGVYMRPKDGYKFEESNQTT